MALIQKQNFPARSYCRSQRWCRWLCLCCQILLIFLCQVDLLWDVSFRTQGSDLWSLFISFLPIVSQWFPILEAHQNSWWIFFFLKSAKSLGVGPRHLYLKTSPQVMDSRVQPELRMNVLNTRFFVLVLLLSAPSKAALQRACCKSLWPRESLLGLCSTIVLLVPSAELLEAGL